jgi:hypothetical protein
MTSFPSAVYLVEDHTADKSDSSGRGHYWVKVYLSRAKAVARVEHWAAAVHHRGPLTWNHNYASWSDGTAAYTIVPLSVFRDQDKEPARAL